MNSFIRSAVIVILAVAGFFIFRPYLADLPQCTDYGVKKIVVQQVRENLDEKFGQTLSSQIGVTVGDAKTNFIDKRAGICHCDGILAISAQGQAVNIEFEYIITRTWEGLFSYNITIKAQNAEIKSFTGAGF